MVLARIFVRILKVKELHGRDQNSPETISEDSWAPSSISVSLSSISFTSDASIVPPGRSSNPATLVPGARVAFTYSKSQLFSNKAEDGPIFPKILGICQESSGNFNRFPQESCQPTSDRRRKGKAEEGGLPFPPLLPSAGSTTRSSLRNPANSGSLSGRGFGTLSEKGETASSTSIFYIIMRVL